HVPEGAIRGIALEDGQNLVVGLAAGEHGQAADRAGEDEDAAGGDGPLGQNAYVDRVAVADDFLPSRPRGGKAGHALGAERAGDEAVGGGAEGRVFLWAVQ